MGGAPIPYEEQILELLRLAAGSNVSEAVREILVSSIPVLGYERASAVIVTDVSESAYVVGATDDPTLSKFSIELDDWPEIRAALSANEVLLIDDVAFHPLLRDRAGLLSEKGVRSSALFPMEWRGRSRGVILYRSSRTRGPADRLDAGRIGFGRLVAGIVSQRLSGGQALDSIREQTHRISLQRYESERRLRAIEQLREYFEATSDGILVLDADAKVLYVNRAAEAITGYAARGLLGSPLADLVPPEQREGVAAVVSRVVQGMNLENFDLDLQTTSGDSICVSVATSTVLAEHGAALFSFRDVTAERALENELRKTKEFLEKLIDSTVDAIVAADIQGTIILFNPGAERIYGYSADEVVGRMHVEKLYPEGVARQVMRMLRSASHGGVGRLELSRREILTKSGELVPVNMTASIIYEDGREVATVGIFSDLRDRIRIEERLLRAQEKLLLTEKQALVAELAGAAAHELNQPLTSVMGYAELLRRKMTPDDPHYRAVDTILSEATRMAEIVKKIGRITKYETKAYVGSAQILDLEKSSARPGDEPREPRPDAPGIGPPGKGRKEGRSR